MTEEEFRQLIEQLDALIQEFESLPFPQVREMVFDLLQGIDAVHREGLWRLAHFLEKEAGSDVLDRAADDPIIHTLFMMYDLTEGDALPQAAHSTADSFVPVDTIGMAKQPAPESPPAYRDVAPVDEVPAGSMQMFDVEGVHVLVANIDGEIHATRNTCPGSLAPLHLGSFSPPIVICPWHNDAFDVRTGERVDGMEGPPLETIPVTVSNGIIQVAVGRLRDGDNGLR